MNGWNCSYCSGPMTSLGVLGEREHGRCRNCGIDQNRGWSFTAAPYSDEEEADGMHYDLAMQFHEEEQLEEWYGQE